MQQTLDASQLGWFLDRKLPPSVQKTLQMSIKSYAYQKLTITEIKALQEELAMHYFCTGTSFVQVEEKHLLKAFKISNSTVVLPTCQKLVGPLLNTCFNRLKIQVDTLLSCGSKHICLTTDGWSNVHSEPIVNYMGVVGK